MSAEEDAAAPSPLVDADPIPEVEGAESTEETDGDEVADREIQLITLPTKVIVLLVCSALTMGFSFSIISIFMNQTLGFGPVDVTKFWLFMGFISWSEPIIGLVADTLTLCGERRRPLFFISGIGSIMCYTLFFARPSFAANFTYFLVVAGFSQVCIIAQYVCLNGLLVDVGRFDGESTKQSTSRIASIISKAMTWRCTGTLLGSVLQTCILTHFSVPSTLGLTTFLFSVLLLLVALMPHQVFVPPSDGHNPVTRLLDGLKEVRSINMWNTQGDGFRFLIVIGYVFLYTMMPDSGTVYNNYLFTFEFPTWYYSLLNCVGYCGNCIGSSLFSSWMDWRAKREAEGAKRLSTFLIFSVGSFCWAIGYVTNIMLCTGFAEKVLRIPTKFFALFDSFWTSIFGVPAYMPVILASTEHAPQGLELSCMQFFSVASMAGGTLSSALTLGLLHSQLHDSMWMLTACSIACKLIVVPFAFLLPDREHGTPETTSLLAAVAEENEEDDEEYGLES